MAVTKRRKPVRSECTIPPPIDVRTLPDLVFGKPTNEEQRVRDYMAQECRQERVLHAEKVGSEALVGRIMGLWDVTTNKGKWWVITNPTNLYSQKLFPSLDYTISFHVGVTARMMARRGQGDDRRFRRLLPTLKKLEAAGISLDNADEVEAFQSVGMQLRECLLSIAKAMSRDEFVPAGQEAPKRGDFIHWMELIADAVAKGQHAQEARSYLKAVSKTTWQLVNWLTHASNAVRHDAQLAHVATESILGAFMTALEKYESKAPDRCPACGSYRVVNDYRPDLGIEPPYVVLCERCDWITPQQVPPERAQAAHEAAGLEARVRQDRRPRNRARPSNGRVTVAAPKPATKGGRRS